MALQIKSDLTVFWPSQASCAKRLQLRDLYDLATADGHAGKVGDCDVDAVKVD
jgi:hypothetical protein